MDAPAAVKTPRPAFKRRGHIVLALLAVLVLVGIVPLATISWKLIRFNRETLATAVQENQLLMASSITRELDVHVQGLSGQLVRVAQALGAAVRRRGVIPRDEIQQVLSELAGGRIRYVRYTYLEQGAVGAVSSGDLPEHLEPLFAASLERAAESLAGGLDAEAPRGAVLSDPILLEGHPPRATLAAAAPVVADGSFRGVLTALIDLERVWAEVGPATKSGNLIFATDEAGFVFASSDPAQVEPGADAGESGLVRQFLNSPNRGSRTLPFVLERDGARERYIGTFDRTQQGWGVFVQAPDSDVYWSVGYMERQTRNWTLALVGIAVLAAMYFARTLSNPINRLAAASRALAAGNLTARVQVDSRNEIGELAHTFNVMADDIQRAFREQEQLFRSTIRALSNAIDARDPYTRGHSDRVNKYALILARELGLGARQLREIDVSSQLHDVGKIGIEDHILKKTGRLTQEEFAIIQTHTTKGADIMAPIAQMAPMIPGIRHHHERCDGSGYPDGLRRSETPLMARIIAVADSFDAITTARPYQQPMTFAAAVARINELSGPALDAEVVAAFNRACAAGRIRPASDGVTVAMPAAEELAPVG